MDSNKDLIVLFTIFEIYTLLWCRIMYVNGRFHHFQETQIHFVRLMQTNADLSAASIDNVNAFSILSITYHKSNYCICI